MKSERKLPNGLIETVLQQSDVLLCPWYILDPMHYRADGSCRCDDPEHSKMLEWGYKWNRKAGEWDDAESDD